MVGARARARIAFVSIIFADPWGGSEELWSRTATKLVAEGYAISASVREWPAIHPRVRQLIDDGVEVWFRPAPSALTQYAWRVLTSPKQVLRHFWRLLAEPQKNGTTVEVERLFVNKRPQLVVISQGDAFPPISLLELCINRRLPFVTIQHANTEAWWIEDDQAERYRVALAAAQRCYFVSKANQRLTEKQIGCELLNAEVLWNPVTIDFNAPLPWPELGPGGQLRFACVGRIDPRAKGQDLLFEALAGPLWAERRWRLYLYGEGPMRNGLERLARHLDLADRVVFAGHASIAEIWARNHLLVMPSRFEGLPLTVIEAMLCGRPVVVTDVAGNAEVVEDGVTGFLARAPTIGSVGEALERFWQRRAEAEMMGKAGSTRMRQLLPADPVEVFAEKIREIVGS